MVKSGDAMKFSYEIEANNFDTAGEVSSKLKRVLKQLGLNSKVIRRIAVAAYEAEINVIIHSDGGFMEASISQDEVNISFVDKGPGIKDIPLAMTEGFSTASDQVRELGFGAGMGLPNIRRCTDDMELKSSEEGTVLKMLFKL
ncbi:MAG: ATP-binding protein [Tissierellales bacterium]|jgi:anti-sigma regulatory factor (Ser/Thr protein kinase)|nr:ATP-binding protein [Tissierellales bacterium]